MNESHTYEGGAFDPALPGGRRGGLLEITAGGLRFLTPDGTHEALHLPLDGLKVAPGGAAGRLIFFTHPRQPERTFHCADPAILKDARLNAQPAIQQQLAGMRRKRGGQRMGLWVAAAAVLLGIYALTWLKDPLINALAAQIPVEWEAKLGNIAFAQVTAGGRIIQDDGLIQDLHKITDPLIEAVNQTSEREYPYEFYIVRDPMLNAFALPGGKVVLHSGLILAAESPEEIAGVLAHEIAHVTNQHSVRQLLSTLGIYLLAQAFLGDMQGLMAVLLDNGAYLLTLKFSRDHERDADLTGLAYLRAAKIQPRGMVDMFKKLQAAQEEMQQEMQGEIEETTGTGDLEMPSFLSTHPDTAERIAELQKLLDESESEISATFRTIPLNFPKFQQRVAQSL